MRILFLITFSLFFRIFPVFSQDSLGVETVIRKPPIRLFAELGVFGSSSRQTPFWFRTNQSGIVPNTAPFLTARAGIQAEFIGKNRKTAWGYGFEGVGTVAAKSVLLVPEAYVKGKWSVFELLVGRRRETIGLADSTVVGSGSYSWSGNALPMPKIQLSLADYTPIGFTKGLIAFRGLYAHGWFDNKGPVTHSYLHQKALYGRIGKPNWPVRFYGGLNHQVQWAGRSTVITGDDVIKNGRFPTGFSNYLNAITGLSLAAKGDAVDTTEYGKNDRGNRVGNHLGTVDVGLEIIRRSFSLLFYRQSIYEDGSLYYLTNLADGLNGLRFRNFKPVTHNWQIQTAVVEFLFTKSQGGSVFSTENKKRGADNYFNHGQYVDGWSYGGRTIGTPFITSALDANPTLPRAYREHLLIYSNNNRVRVMHAGLVGSYRSNYIFQLKASLSDNYGTYSLPFPERVRQFSSLISVSFPVTWLDGAQATVSMSSDWGKLYTNRTGFYVSLRKSWQAHSLKHRQPLAPE
ncbi:capsule assembly Wzi family protein [Larkinella sp. C7]|uniref:capsule assembly Wzi family protein n=1 Tax=Larkinella sp. C7 TaxID=2576607 RepID=UPI0011112ED7|nr:capsule assembly Wzi family protein [Larkinella sp. C7]